MTAGSTTAEDTVAAVRPAGDAVLPATVAAAAAWTALIEPGDRIAGALLRLLGPEQALDALRLDAPPTRNRELLARFARWRAAYDAEAAARAVRNAARIGARLVLPGDADWPRGLEALQDAAPPALWALAPSGPLPDLDRSVALVGNRDVDDYGSTVTWELGCGLADRGFAIVSGAALGVDRVAHRSALRSGAVTAAVVAGGLDRIYPAENEDLLHRIAATGAVLSEVPCGSRPMKQRFLSRNRLIAAITRATVVTRAGVPSGAISTAGHAGELGRPVGAVPGPVGDPRSAGCHKLLRDYAAVLVRNAADAAELARDPDEAVPLDGVDVPLDPEERRVLDALGRQPRPVVEVARRAGLDAAATTAALGMLSLAGAAVEHGRGWSRG